MAEQDETDAIISELQHMPLDVIQFHIERCGKRFLGELDPVLDKERLAPTVPYRLRCQEVLRWVLAMQDVQDDDEVFDQQRGADRSGKSLRLVQAFYRNFMNTAKGNFLTEMPKPTTEPSEQTRETSEQTRIKNRECWYKLGTLHTIILNVDKVAKSMHILSRLLYDKDDKIANLALVNPYRSWQEKRWVHDYEKWNNKQGDEPEDEAADLKKIKCKDVNVVVKHCLDVALENRWRRLGSCVYEERQIVFNDVIYGSRAFQPVVWPRGIAHLDKSTLEEFVTRACAKELYPQIWELAMDAVTFSKVVKYLERCEDMEFPRLHMQRRLFSFQNGIYDSQEGKLGAFYFYDKASLYLPPMAVAANFFEHEVQAHWFDAGSRLGGWFDIATPLFQSILDYQNYGTVRAPVPSPQPEASEASPLEVAVDTAKRELHAFVMTMENAVLDATWSKSPQDKTDALLSMTEHCQTLRDALRAIVAPLRGEEAPGATRPAPPLGDKQLTPGKVLPQEVQRWIYIFLGRLLHDLHTFDSWQIMPFLKGKAGTGKSAIGMVAQSFFQPGQVGVVSNNIEAKFGLSMIADRFVILCLEVKKDFQMSQSEFQSIVSGELLQLAVKNKEAYQKKWSAPGLFCGNEWAKYQDAQGSIARRLALVNFSFSVQDQDSKPNLQSDIIKHELGALLVKCNMAYREQADIKKGQDIWKILPEYFKHQRKQLQIDTDPLMAAIYDSTIFERKATGHVAFHDLKKEYHQKWKQIRNNNYPDQLTEEKWLPAFKEAKLELCWKKMVDPALGGGEARLDHWVLGLRRVRDIVDAEDGAAGAPDPSGAL